MISSISPLPSEFQKGRSTILLCQGLKSFLEHETFRFLLKPDSSGQTRISWFCSLIIFTWNGVYSLYPFSSGVLIYLPFSPLQVSSAPIQSPHCNSVVLFKTFPCLSMSIRGSPILEHVYNALLWSVFCLESCPYTLWSVVFTDLSCDLDVPLCPIAPCTFFCLTIISLCS